MRKHTLTFLTKILFLQLMKNKKSLLFCGSNFFVLKIVITMYQVHVPTFFPHCHCLFMFTQKKKKVTVYILFDIVSLSFIIFTFSHILNYFINLFKIRVLIISNPLFCIHSHILNMDIISRFFKMCIYINTSLWV